MERAGKETVIPDGWRLVRLGDVLKLEYGISLPERDRQFGDVPVIGSAGVVGFHSKSAVQGPGVVVGRKGSIGSVTWIDDAFVPIDTTYYVTPQKGHANLRWLYYLLDRENLSVLNRATGVPGLNRDDVYALRRPIPPLPEQRAIANVLDSIDDAIERTEAVIAATETLRDSLLHELLTRGVPGWHTQWKDAPGIGTIPADWEVVRLGEVIPKFEYGTSVQCTSDPTGVPVLRIPNIASGELNLTELKYANLSTAEMEKLCLAPGDVLLVRTNGNPEICGQSWVTNGLEGNWAFASYLVRGRPDQSRVNPAFAGHFMRSESGRRSLRGHIRTSAGNYNLSVGDLGSIPFPCPALVEQERIVQSIAGSTKLIDDLRDELTGLTTAKRSTADALLSGRERVGDNDA